MKVNVEKCLHETAQEHENLVRLCRDSKIPKAADLGAVLEHSAWLMRLAHAKLNAQADKIRELEEEISIWRSFMVPEPVRGQRWRQEVEGVARESEL